MDLSACGSEQWAELMSMLPGDIEETVRQSGVLRRRREVRDAATLVLLAMSYAVIGRSLRETAAWAQRVGLANLSDVALLKRLKSAADWLGSVCGQMLAERARVRLRQWNVPRVRIVDATCVSRRRSTGTDWRIHMTYDLGRGTIENLELTDGRVGETFQRLTVERGDVILGDRGYAHRRGIHWVASHDGDVVVRLNLTNVPLLDMAEQPFDILRAASHLQIGQVLDVPVMTAPGGKSGVPAVAGRLVALRKSEVAAVRERRKMSADAKRKRRVANPQVLRSADYVFLFTTLPVKTFSAADVLELYRFRWMIELAFKRLKGILAIDEIPAQDEHLCRTFLFTKLLAALLVEDLTQAHVAFSPWGYGRPTAPIPLARSEVRPAPAPSGNRRCRTANRTAAPNAGSPDEAP